MPFLRVRACSHDRHMDCHFELAVGRSDKTAGDGNGLTDVAGDRNPDQVAAIIVPLVGS